MPRFFTCIFLSCLCIWGHAQNLVPNPSFEEHWDCPNTSSGTSLSKYWYSAGNSPDYFNGCAYSWWQSVPLNTCGYADAYDGQAYQGFAIWLDNGNNTSPREWIGTELENPLKKDKEYCYSFFVTLSDSSMYASSDIQIAFSKDSVYVYSATQSSGPVRVINNESDTIFSEEGWIEISGKFVAEGWERHLIIGNFKKHDETAIDSVGGASWGNWVYPFVDMVSLTYCSPFIEPVIPNIFTPNNDAVNDTWFIEDTLNQIISVKIYNRWGNIVFEKDSPPFEWDGNIHGNKANHGVYFYVLQYYAEPDKIKEKTGTIHIAY